jgi:hypothetical protein
MGVVGRYDIDDLLFALQSGTARLVLAGGREIRVNAVNQRADIVAHRLICNEHHHRDRGHYKSVLRHSLSSAQTPTALANSEVRCSQNVHIHYPLS